MYKQFNRFILHLAFTSIQHYFSTGKFLEMDPSEILPELLEKRACFVTLTIAGELRGCIGHIEPSQALYKDIIENAVNAAFGDDRFSPLTKEEFEKVEIEVSILTQQVELNFSSAGELLEKLHSGIDGVILEKGSKGATYLPQVWEEMPDKAEFLSSLCAKAGLDSNEWKNPGIKVFVYQVEAIKR